MSHLPDLAGRADGGGHPGTRSEDLTVHAVPGLQLSDGLLVDPLPPVRGRSSTNGGLGRGTTAPPMTLGALLSSDGAQADRP